MARYINADVVTDELQNMADDVDKDFGLLDRNSQYMMERGLQMACQYIINLAPTSDVQEVVRCEDCRYCVGLFSCKKNEEQLRRCQRFGLNLIDGNGYCSWGET